MQCSIRRKTMKRSIVASNPSLFYSPKERRRLARTDSSPCRRFALQIPVVKPRWEGSTESALSDFVLLNLTHIRRRDFDVECKGSEVTIRIRGGDRFGARAIFDLQRNIVHALSAWTSIDIDVLF